MENKFHFATTKSEDKLNRKRKSSLRVYDVNLFSAS